MGLVSVSGDETGSIANCFACRRLNQVFRRRNHFTAKYRRVGQNPRRISCGTPSRRLRIALGTRPLGSGKFGNRGAGYRQVKSWRAKVSPRPTTWKRSRRKQGRSWCSPRCTATPLPALWAVPLLGTVGLWPLCLLRPSLGQDT